MAYKQLPGFGVQLPELTFDGVSPVLGLYPEFWQLQPLYNLLVMKFTFSMMLFPSSKILDSIKKKGNFKKVINLHLENLMYFHLKTVLLQNH